MDSPGDNSNRQPYKRRCVLGNLGDFPSIEAFTIKNNQNNKSPENYSRVYVKSKTKYNNN